jgi:ubiquinone/menaquinone biosynthesis C-methylase UbiE
MVGDRAMASYFETPDLGRTTQQLVELFEVQAECYGFIDIENTSSVIARIDARNVLDVGTGEGAFLLSLARRNPQRKFVGIDLNAEFIQVFNRRISESRLPNVQAIECELKENTDILDNDLVFCRLTAQHSADPISFLSNMKKGLRDGGWILCIEPIYKYYDSDPLAPVWKEYRERLFCSYRRMNSDPNIPMRVSGWLKVSVVRDFETDGGLI